MSHDIVDKFSTHLKNVLTRALCLVVEQDQGIIHPEHLLWAMGTQKGCIAAEILKKSGVKASDLKMLIGVQEPVRAHSQKEAESLPLRLSDDAKRILEKAVLTANIYGHRYVGTEHLLSGIIQINPQTTEAFFTRLQVDMQELKSQLEIVLKSTSRFPDVANGAGRETVSTLTTLQPTQKEDASAEKKNSALEYFAIELTTPQAQTRIDPIIGRESEIQRVMEILCRRVKNNPLLLGEPGVGKTAIVEGLAKLIVQGHVPPALAHKRIFTIDMALLIAGTMYRGEFEGRLRQIVEEVKQDTDVLLFIDEIHTIVGTGSASGSMDAANILKPALARGDIRCIGATTPNDFKKYIESDAALERRFQTISVEEPSPAHAIEILEGLSPSYEQFHRVRISRDALEKAVSLSCRYLPERRLPDKAIDLIDEAAAAARIRSARPDTIQQERELKDALTKIKETKRQAVVEECFEEAGRLKDEESKIRAHLQSLSHTEDLTPFPTITGDDVARIISRICGIPLEDLVASDQSQLMKLEKQLGTEVVGQDPVIATVAGALRRAKTGIAHPNRPLASFLFLGPSGVGKTELAKTIARVLFQDTHRCIRLDMSEYAEGFTMSKLIGAPAGYVGYKEGSNLTDRVKQHPHCVVLFDEMEKAHRDVQNLLLQILEEGELTDATGRKVHFKNAIIILTSNVGLERFERGNIGFVENERKMTLSLDQDVRAELQEKFRPELLNRIDHLCLFQTLTQDVLKRIVRKQLDELEERLKTQKISIVFHENLIPYLLSRVDHAVGARSIRTLIAREIEHGIAQRLTKTNRPSKLNVQMKGGTISITKGR